MSEPINDGGAAFPSPYALPENKGMSLRDYFAAKALQGILANPECASSNDAVCKAAYRCADTMLAARQS